MKPIKITVHPDRPVGVIRLSPEAEAVIRQLQRETGLSAKALASQIIIQAADLIEVNEKK